MKIVVDTITSSTLSLQLGCVLHYTENGPIRFCLVEVPLELLTPTVCGELTALSARVMSTYLDAEARESEQPLF